MRQRKVKDLDAKIQAVSAFLVEDPSPQVWDRVFAGGDGAITGGPAAAVRPRFLEIGCGKGAFLLQLALRYPESDFIGIEGQASVVLRAMEKAARIEAGDPQEDDPFWMKEAAAQSWPQGLRNVRFACVFVNEMEEFFSPGSLAGVYLNFSDPWPKARHARRRLTWRGRLQDYARAIRPGGFIAVKTDNDALFAFTLEEIKACGWTPAEMTWDLHGPGGPEDVGVHRPGGPGLEGRQIMTEYERKFHQAGKSIHYVRIAL